MKVLPSCMTRLPLRTFLNKFFKMVLANCFPFSTLSSQFTITIVMTATMCFSPPQLVATVIMQNQHNWEYQEDPVALKKVKEQVPIFWVEKVLTMPTNTESHHEANMSDVLMSIIEDEGDKEWACCLFLSWLKFILDASTRPLKRVRDAYCPRSQVILDSCEILSYIYVSSFNNGWNPSHSLRDGMDP
ncbi:hypothetical protein F5146DRAFT_1005333 [Armillaria mellea]|nr:hypothetical protein F5146DRAFT_1005333 [Armillaria mellea]